jgi:rhamnogalacturonyl hydrolase YesR
MGAAAPAAIDAHKAPANNQARHFIDSPPPSAKPSSAMRDSIGSAAPMQRLLPEGYRMKHVFALALVLSVPAIGADAPARKDVLALAARVADWQLQHMDAKHVTHFKDESREPRSWEQGAFWVGVTRLADASGEKRFSKAILDMGRANAWKPGPRLYHADDHVITQSYLWAASHGAGAEAIAPLRASFDAILAKPANAHLSFYPEKNYEETACLRRWCWCDALFMSPPAWVELSRQTGDPRYTEFALKEFWATTDFLYDPVEKLYFRDSRFFDRRDEQGRKLFWSRGNGWVFAGIANLLESLPGDDPHRPRMEALFKEMAARLRSLQKPDGYWAPSLLGAENSPPETSGTGFYVYGLAWGVKHGLLDAGEYRPAIDSGWAALTRAVAKDGRLGWVQQVSDRPDKVAEADTQFYGVGAFLLAASGVATISE